MSLLKKLFPRVHVFMYRLSNGKLGGRRKESKVLLLSTIGRKTGKERVTPLRYIKHGDDFVIAASNWGQENPPAWYFNLKANPNIQIQDMDQHIKVKAEEAGDDLHAELYPRFVKADSRFADYPTTAKRQIPLILLHPQR
jgi:deazaflavin-dependent oxidoreductase (nitroreductase family)